MLKYAVPLYFNNLRKVLILDFQGVSIWYETQYSINLFDGIFFKVGKLSFTICTFFRLYILTNSLKNLIDFDHFLLHMFFANF